MLKKVVTIGLIGVSLVSAMNPSTDLHAKKNTYSLINNAGRMVCSALLLASTGEGLMPLYPTIGRHTRFNSQAIGHKYFQQLSAIGENPDYVPYKDFAKRDRTKDSHYMELYQVFANRGKIEPEIVAEMELPHKKITLKVAIPASMEFIDLVPGKGGKETCMFYEEMKRNVFAVSTTPAASVNPYTAKISNEEFLCKLENNPDITNLKLLGQTESANADYATLMLAVLYTLQDRQEIILGRSYNGPSLLQVNLSRKLKKGENPETVLAQMQTFLDTQIRIEEERVNRTTDLLGIGLLFNQFKQKFGV